ncbi:MAG: Hsp20/alpha crystallin family protein [Bacteroidia bacterium]|nr:Hsp20/alpha crystallin family protein [Bacteroidia bacterium]
MTLIKVNNPTKQFVNPMWNNLFNDFFTTRFTGEEHSSHVPSVNIVEDKNLYEIHVSAPGFNKDNFKIEVEQNVLSISGEYKTENTENNSERKYTRKEFSYGSFKRSWTLPENIETESIKASYENGILNVEIPKKVQEPVKTTREIKVS